MEEKSVGEGKPRIKFDLVRMGEIPQCVLDSPIYTSLCSAFAQALKCMEDMGATPILPDGKVGGNGAVAVDVSSLRLGSSEAAHGLGTERFLIVSKSGKYSQEILSPKDFVIVESFSIEKWCVYYRSVDESIKPTSDTPLLFSSLMTKMAVVSDSPSALPSVSLHGHALETEADAAALNLPISPEETLFSTYEDLKALEDLMIAYPYPNTCIYIRKGHGFFLVSDHFAEAHQVLETVIEPFISSKTKPDTVITN